MMFGPTACTPWAFVREVVLRIGAIGFEPTAFWSQTRRSAKLSYAPFNRHEYIGLRATRRTCRSADYFNRTSLPLRFTMFL